MLTNVNNQKDKQKSKLLFGQCIKELLKFFLKYSINFFSFAVNTFFYQKKKKLFYLKTIPKLFVF
jgi:hypothetical protein